MSTVINPEAAQSVMRQLAQKINDAPAEEFAKAMRQLEIQQHNAAIDQAKAEKKGKKARMRDLMKRMKKARPGKPYAGKPIVALAHPSQLDDLRG